MATREEQIELLEAELATLAEETRRAYRTWRKADEEMSRVGNELRVLRRRPVEGE